MENLYSSLIMKLIYWKRDVIRNDIIFRDVSDVPLSGQKSRKLLYGEGKS